MMLRFLIRASAVSALATLVACAAPEPRSEVGVITSPVDEVWEAFVEVVKDGGFELETVDPSRHLISGARDSTSSIGWSIDPSQRFGKATRTQYHALRASMTPRGDQSTVIEVVYLIDKIPDEEASFALLNAVRERLAKKGR